MTRTVPKHIVRKLYRINELVTQAQGLQEQVQEWLEKQGASDGWDFMVECSNTVADGYDVQALLDSVHRELWHDEKQPS